MFLKRIRWLWNARCDYPTQPRRIFDLPIKAIWALFLLAALSLQAMSFETQAGIVVVGGILTPSGSGSGYTEGLTLVDPANPGSPLSLAPGDSVTYNFDQTSGFFQSDPRATTPFPFVTNDSTFSFGALLLDANNTPVDTAQSLSVSPNANESGGSIEFLGLTTGTSFAPVFLANIYDSFNNVLGTIQAGYVGDTPSFVIANTTTSDTFDSPSLFAAGPASPPANSVPEPASLTLLVM